MELLCQLDTAATADFFTTFFRLPNSYWRGFLASKLSSGAACGPRSQRQRLLVLWGVQLRMIACCVGGGCQLVQLFAFGKVRRSPSTPSC